jgi:hypothetical protein
MKAAKLSLLNPRFWLKVVALAEVIAWAVIWWHSLTLNIVYREHIWFSAQELKEYLKGIKI